MNKRVLVVLVTFVTTLPIAASDGVSIEWHQSNTYGVPLVYVTITSADTSKELQRWSVSKKPSNYRDGIVKFFDKEDTVVHMSDIQESLTTYKILPEFAEDMLEKLHNSATCMIALAAILQSPAHKKVVTLLKGNTFYRLSDAEGLIQPWLSAYIDESSQEQHILFYNQERAAATPTTVFLDLMERGATRKTALLTMGTLITAAHVKRAEHAPENGIKCVIS